VFDQTTADERQGCFILTHVRCIFDPTVPITIMHAVQSRCTATLWIRYSTVHR